MLDPDELIAAALSLLDVRPVRQAHIRRAISTAYYALFHDVVGTAMRMFVSHGPSAGAYALIYRSFDHRHMRQACEDLGRIALGRKARDALGRAGLSQDARDFSGTFVTLQDARHRADYDPIATFRPSDAASFIDEAKAGRRSLARLDPKERADLLAFLMVRARSG